MKQVSRHGPGEVKDNPGELFTQCPMSYMISQSKTHRHRDYIVHVSNADDRDHELKTMFSNITAGQEIKQVIL